MSANGGPDIITNGLVLHLDAADIKSYPRTGAVWYDRSGNGNNGTLTNGPTFDSGNGGGIVFDGVDDRGTFTSPIASNSPQTYEVWVKAIPSSLSDGFGYILHNNSNNTNIGGSYMVIGYAGSNLQTREIFAAFNGAWLSMGTGVIGDTTTVRHIILTWNGSTQIAYVDGVQRAGEAGRRQGPSRAGRQSECKTASRR